MGGIAAHLGSPGARSRPCSEARTCAGSRPRGRPSVSATGGSSSPFPSTPTTRAGRRPSASSSSCGSFRPACSRRSSACSATATGGRCVLFASAAAPLRSRRGRRAWRLEGRSCRRSSTRSPSSTSIANAPYKLRPGGDHADAREDAERADRDERRVQHVESLAFFLGPALAGLLLAVTGTRRRLRVAAAMFGFAVVPHSPDAGPEAPRRRRRSRRRRSSASAWRASASSSGTRSCAC